MVLHNSDYFFTKLLFAFFFFQKEKNYCMFLLQSLFSSLEMQ